MLDGLEALLLSLTVSPVDGILAESPIVDVCCARCFCVVQSAKDVKTGYSGAASTDNRNSLLLTVVFPAKRAVKYLLTTSLISSQKNGLNISFTIFCRPKNSKKQKIDSKFIKKSIRFSRFFQPPMLYPIAVAWPRFYQGTFRGLRKLRASHT